MLVNSLAFTSVYFSESGFFNGLRPIQIKKIRSSPSPERLDDMSISSPLLEPGKMVNSSMRNTIRHVLNFVNKLSVLIAIAVG